MNDDLLRVIATYTTTKVTLDLLALFLPETLYAPSFWRRKTLKESLGLVFDDDVVANQWYPYYLYQNRTYYGDVAFATPNAHSSRGFRHILYYYEGCEEYRGKMAVTQSNDYTLTVNGRILSGFPMRKVRIAAINPYPYAEIVLVDEYGDVWHSDDQFFMTRYAFRDVVTLVERPEDAPVFLQRDGVIRTLKQILDRHVAHVSPLSEYDTRYVTIDGYVTTDDPMWDDTESEQERLTMKRLGGYSSTSVGVFLYSLMPFEEVLVEPDFGHIRGVRIVSMSHGSYETIFMTTDRSAYMADAERGPTLVRSTKGRTQRVATGPGGAYAIVDPV